MTPALRKTNYDEEYFPSYLISHFKSFKNNVKILVTLILIKMGKTGF